MLPAIISYAPATGADARQTSAINTSQGGREMRNRERLQKKTRGKDWTGVHDLDGNRAKGDKEKDMEKTENPDPGCL